MAGGWGMWGGNAVGQPGLGSGQFQELQQRVLFHSLHKQLIVLGEGMREVVT